MTDKSLYGIADGNHLVCPQFCCTAFVFCGSHCKLILAWETKMRGKIIRLGSFTPSKAPTFAASGSNTRHEHDIEAPFYCLLITADWCHSCFPLTSLFFGITSSVSYKKPPAITPVLSLLIPLSTFPYPLVAQLCSTVRPA